MTRRIVAGEREFVKCACHGWIDGPANAGREKERGQVVVEHQASAQHQSFDVEKWRDEITPDIEVRIAAPVLTRVG